MAAAAAAAAETERARSQLQTAVAASVADGDGAHRAAVAALERRLEAAQVCAHSCEFGVRLKLWGRLGTTSTSLQNDVTNRSDPFGSDPLAPEVRV